MTKKLCGWCNSVLPADRPQLTYCGISCAVRYRNAHNNPMKKASARAKVSAAAKLYGTAHMMTAEVRARAAPKISASAKSRARKIDGTFS